MPPGKRRRVRADGRRRLPFPDQASDDALRPVDRSQLTHRAASQRHFEALAGIDPGEILAELVTEFTSRDLDHASHCDTSARAAGRPWAALGGPLSRWAD